MEFARYPIYESRVLAVHSDLDVLGRRPLVNGLTAAELLAEKVAAVAGRSYIKGRDLFDLWYLSEILGTSVELPLVEKKFHDYNVALPVSQLEQKLADYRTESLTSEMQRFLPERYRRLLKVKSYEEIRQAAMRVVEPVIAAFSSRKRS